MGPRRAGKSTLAVHLYVKGCFERFCFVRRSGHTLGSTGIAVTTLRRHLALLGAAYFVKEIPAWQANFGKRLVKAGKVGVLEAAMAAHLQGIDNRRLELNRDKLGPLLESFVGDEISKQISWSKQKISRTIFAVTVAIKWP